MNPSSSALHTKAPNALNQANQAEPDWEPSAGLLEALGLALETAPQVMANLVGRAMLGIDRQATAHPDTAQRSLLDAAAVAMDQQRSRWSKQFTALLRVSLSHRAPSQAALPAVDVRVCAAELAQLDALVQAEGYQRDNPLAPASYVRALLELIARSKAGADIKQVWQDYLLAALGTQLAWVYLQMAASLRSPGLRGVNSDDDTRAVKSLAGSVFGAGYAESIDLAHSESEVDAQADVNENANEDLEVVARDSGAFLALPTTQSASQAVSLPIVQQIVQLASPPDAVPSVSPEMRAMAVNTKRTVVQLRNVLGWPAPAPLKQAQSELERMMKDLEEVEQLMAEIQARGLEVPVPETEAEIQEKRQRQVERLLEEYRSATAPSLARVPVPLRDALDQLRPALERLAVFDDAVFTEPTHPVRLFLDAVTQRSFLFASESTEGFRPFFGPVNKMLEALSQIAVPTAKMYEQALQRLQTVWAQQNIELEKIQQNRQLRTSQLQEQKVLASRLAFELVGRRDAADAPAVVKQFLMGPWALVLARAKLHPQQPHDAQRYDSVTALLLWSCSVQRAGSRKDQLLSLRPHLLESLRDGLNSVDHPQSAMETFMQELQRAHEPVLAYEGPSDSADGEPPPINF